MTRRWRALAVTGVAGAIVCLAAAGVVAWRVRQALRGSTAAVEAGNTFTFEVRRIANLPNPGFEWISAPAVFSGGAVYKGHLYLCGPAGLLEYDERGALLKHYRPGLELPAAPLVQMVRGTLTDSAGPELLIATAGEGVLAFDGDRFRQIRPDDAEARKITALLPLSTGQLLLGTSKRGVLFYDGKHLSYFHPTLKDLAVTALAGTGADLWVGTLNESVFHWRGGDTEHIDESGGLPDRQVLALAVNDDVAYVGTPVGVAEFVDGKRTRNLADGVFARSLFVEHKAAGSAEGGNLLVGTEDQGMLEVPLHAARGGIRVVGGEPAGVPDGGLPGARSGGEVEQFFTTNGGEAAGDPQLYALTQSGLYERQQDGGQRTWKRVLDRAQTLMTDRNVSALMAGKDARLWVGYFDRGLDVLSANDDRSEHLEDGNLFCVNRIVQDAGQTQIAVATANGLVMFDATGRKRQVLGKSSGLIAEHVTDVLPYRGGLAVATPAGLTFLDGSGAHSIYAFQGLVNNHVYALGVAGNRLMAGTLGGLSVVDSDAVSRNFTTATSSLKHNWITAVAPAGDEWFVGTYGAGVVRMNSEGRFEPGDPSMAGVEVNPNAMLVTDRHVFAGTLGSGLLVYDRASGRWRRVTDGLPSNNITAFARKDSTLYIGTDNGLVRIEEQSLDR